MTTYDLDHLTFINKIELLYAEKSLKHSMKLDELLIAQLIPVISSEKMKLYDKHNNLVQFSEDGILYEINTYQGIESDHFSVGIRFNKYDYFMIRFDFGKTLRHTNNMNTENEEIIEGSHLHFYSHTDKSVSKNVIPIDKLKKFIHLNCLADTLQMVIQYTNIIIE
ncbi:DUF6978 family protein [Convivina praedatoris]|uniref:Uncharacterized protein n=1 Tax=Convivina praedatoris TaxID=2880963 RepID=A0ABM9D4R2_9LACO|nr:hypothetical protein [Convivina sp. LMG 32447]CAH1854505.1 hypothetical protein R077815_01063 [Convivina sp. LMG 32447]CAH1855724.1 hypothetical protein R078138_01198 [Convivina sp. LMG 32447]CAH1855848.1 hypothetical protein LMG032447_01177 [Convivina sp. LMG 32447]